MDTLTFTLITSAPTHKRDWLAIQAEVRQLVADNLLLPSGALRPGDTRWIFKSGSWSIKKTGLEVEGELDAFLSRLVPFTYTKNTPKPKKGNAKPMTDNQYAAALRTTPELLQADPAEVFSHITIERLTDLAEAGQIGDLSVVRLHSHNNNDYAYLISKSGVLEAATARVAELSHCGFESLAA